MRNFTDKIPAGTPEIELQAIETTVLTRSLEIDQLAKEVEPLSKKIGETLFWAMIDANPQLSQAYRESKLDVSKLSSVLRQEFEQIESTILKRTTLIIKELLGGGISPENLEKKMYEHIFWAIMDTHPGLAQKYMSDWSTRRMEDKEREHFANIQAVVDVKKEQIRPLIQAINDVKYKIYQQVFWGMMDHRAQLADEYMKHWDATKLTLEEKTELKEIESTAERLVTEVIGLVMENQHNVKKVQLLLLQSILMAKGERTVRENLLLGDTGNEVKKLQKALIELGYLHIHFDQETEKALTRLQEDLKLVMSEEGKGKLGPKTRSALNKLVQKKEKVGNVDPTNLPNEYLIFPKNLMSGDRGTEVAELQKLLIDLGYLHHEFDLATLSAVGQLQNDLNLDIQKQHIGKLGPKTRNKMNETLVDKEKSNELKMKQRLRREKRSVDTYIQHRMVTDRVKKYLPRYREMLEKDANSLPAMHKKCRISVCVPAHLEEKNICKLLNGYLDQKNVDGSPLDPDLFEINIIVNRQEGIQPDKTVDVIKDFQKKHPKLHINVVDKVFPKTDPGDLQKGMRVASVGTARKYIGDLSLVRSRKQERTVPLYILTEDADEEYIGPYNISKAIEKLDSKPHLDALRGVIDMPAQAYMQNQFLLFARRLQDFIEVSARGSKLNAPWTWQGIRTGGQDTVFTAEAYSIANGTPFGATQGEDLSVGDSIRRKRKTLGTIETVNNITVSDPRRMLFNIAERGTITTAYGGGKSESSNFLSDDVRSFDWPKIIDQIPGKKLTSENQNLFEREAGRFAHLALSIFVWNAFDTQPSQKQLTEALGKGIKLFERAMFFLGFKKEDYQLSYNCHISEFGWPQLDSCRVSFNNITNIQASLDSYPEKYQKHVEHERKKHQKKLERLQGKPA